MTVLFADVAGSTALGETLDPEDVRALMSRYYESAQAAVEAHGGTLEKFIGDAVMAVFGLPRAHGDDPERAVAAALALRDAVRSNSELEAIQLRFGLATGEVVATREVSGGHFLVTGDAVNVAARLQQAADTWEILATERTAFDASGRFEFDAARELPVKGRAEPVRVRALVGATTRSARPALGFVGREDELDQLRLTARRALRDRSPAVVSIVAAAGIGKSRLVEQFTSALLPELAPGARIEVAQCLPYGNQLTYWPLRSVLFGLAGIDESASPQQIQMGLQSWLGAGRESELLAATVGAENAETAAPTELFAAWRSAIARAASEQPLVLIFEDLHWSSDSLLDLVEFVMDPNEPVPVLTLAIARPELIDRRPAWGGGRRNFVSLYLDPLPEADIVAVVSPLLEGAPDELVRQVVKRCEGNPFFAGELARAAAEAGDVALPDTVQAAVLARLDLLPEAARRLLQVASVFGRSFRPAGVAALDPALDGLLDELLESLRGRDLLRRADAEHMAFRHILIREVAYSTLARGERARLHGAAGDWLETRAEGREDAVAEMVALHFREAAILRGPAEVRRKAAVWLRRAGESAARAAATREAEAHLRAALEFAEPGDETAEIWLRMGEVLSILPGGAEAYLRAREAATSIRNRQLAAAGALQTGVRWGASSRTTQEVIAEVLAEVEATIEGVTDIEVEGRLRAGLSFKPYWLSGQGRAPSADLDAAQANGERAAQIGRELDLPDLVSSALDGLGSVAQRRGDYQLAREFAQSRLQFGQRLSSHERRDAEHMVTWMSYCLGEPKSALASAEATFASLRAGQLPDWRLSATSWRLRGQLVLGRWEDAMRTARDELNQMEQLKALVPAWVQQSVPFAQIAARNRGEWELAEALAAAVRMAVPPSTPFRRLALALVDEDPARVLTSMEESAGAGVALGEQEALMYLSDLRAWPDRVPEWLRRYLEAAIVPCRLQGLRAVGLIEGDRALLQAALELARQTSDIPAVARLAVETGSEEEGRAALEAMGDRGQLERYGLV